MRCHKIAEVLSVRVFSSWNSSGVFLYQGSFNISERRLAFMAQVVKDELILNTET